MDRRVQPIAIGPIKYVTHDTIRYEKTVFYHTPPGVRATFSYIRRRQVDHGGASPTIWTDGWTGEWIEN